MKKIYFTFTFILCLFVCVNAQIITTIAGNGISGYSGNGAPALSALLKQPNQLGYDQSGNLIVAEDRNHVIRKIDALGNISTVAGNGTQGFSGDGGLAINAQLNRATGVTTDAAGNIYICDGENYRIRKVNTLGIITTIAGTGTLSYSGDGGLAINAEIGFTSGICLDAAGNIYFADQNGGYCIRKINTSGIISTFAGNGTSGFSGDGGQAASAQLVSPASIFLDGLGNFYIGDFGGMRVRKVNSSGIISTIAGNGSAASGGDGMLATSAQLFYPYDVVADAVGNVYICEPGNNKIRKVDPSGVMSTFAGIGGFIGGYSGDGGLAINAQLYHPSAICLDLSGNIIIGDYENNVIRKVTLATNIFNNNLTDAEFAVYPNPSSSFITIENKNAELITIKLFAITGQIVLEQQSESNKINIELNQMSSGVYNMTIKNKSGVVNKKVIVTK